MDGIPYNIERTKNRSSRATIRNGAIHIRLARGLPLREEERHINSLLQRMKKAYVTEIKKISLDPFAALFHGENCIHIDIATSTLISFRVQDGRKTKAMQVAEGWSVLRGMRDDDKTFHRFLWKLLAESLSEEIDSLVRNINAETYQEDIKKVTLKYMRTRWGSCSHDGVITLSTPLLFTTPDILRYVIIHELAHLKHPNHSKAFWNHVAKFSPDFLQLRKKLQGFKLPRE